MNLLTALLEREMNQLAGQLRQWVEGTSETLHTNSSECRICYFNFLSIDKITEFSFYVNFILRHWTKRKNILLIQKCHDVFYQLYFIISKVFSITILILLIQNTCPDVTPVEFKIHCVTSTITILYVFSVWQSQCMFCTYRLKFEVKKL